jgi:adenosylcobinamide-GDP ribazoletransferase
VSTPRQLTLFVVATQFLTRLPTPRVAAFEPEWLRRSLRYFPLVGGVIGLVNVAVWWVCIQWLPASVAVGLMLGASLLVTGAFHEDGFADACDGFGGGATATRTLEIMKDSRIGALGAIGIFMMLGLKWAAIVSLPTLSLPLLIVCAHVVSRWCAIGLVWRLRYVRSDEGAKSQPFDGGLSGTEWVVAALLGAVVVALVTSVTGLSRLEAEAVGAGVVAAALLAAGCALYFRARIGGYTGDCLGAVQQLTELAFIVVALAVLRSPSHLV